MGGSFYDLSTSHARTASHRAAGTDSFTHTADVHSGKVDKAVHALLDPKHKNSAGKIVRESLDSDAAPNSRAIAVLFDVTGSMRDTPRTFQTKLAMLMTSLIKRNYIPNPHILLGAIGDANWDSVPLQVGQFEGGNEADEALEKVFLEGGGGGGGNESYELAMYFMEKYTVMDCWNKRGEKGYLFLLGDELPYPTLSSEHVLKVIGEDAPSETLTVKQILAKLQEKFHVFWIRPGDTENFNSVSMVKTLQGLLGQNLLSLPNPDDVCELIISTIAVTEGYDINDVASGLRADGAANSAVGAAVTALSSYTGGAAVVKRATVSGGELVPAGAEDGVVRIG